MQGLIAGNMNEPYRQNKTETAGNKQNRSKTGTAGRRQSKTGARQGVEYSRTASGFAAEDGVQYDVSSGRSRVAQLLSEQYGGADMYNTSVPKSGQSEAAMGKTTEDADTSVPKNGHTKRGSASTNTSAINTGAVLKNGQTSDADLTMSGDEQDQNGETMPWDDISEQDMESDLSYLEDMLKRLQESRRNASKNKTNTKKALSYSYRRVSAAIMRAKTQIQAGNALSSAKSELASLKRKAGSGQYKDEEIQIAVNHANKMIRAARKKVANMKLEEMHKQHDDGAVRGGKQKTEAIKKTKAVRENTSEKAKLDKQMELMKKRLKQLSEAEKNGHRRSENYELLQADMEYLKKKIDLMRQEQNGTSDDNEQNTIDAATTGATGTTETTTAVGTASEAAADTGASAAELAQQGMEATASGGEAGL